MDKIIELTEELKLALEEEPLFIEYKKVKNEVDNSSELNELKKLIVRAKNENRLDDHKVLVNQYENHPMMLNFRQLEIEMYDYLSEVSNILNKK